jgi:integrase/recombinase XerC
MRVQKFSPDTIEDRLKILTRLERYAAKPLLDATADDLRSFQRTFAHLAPASVNIYSRHIKAFYDWAMRRRLVEQSPAADMLIPDVPRGRPHPTRVDDLRVIFACTQGPLRLAYALAAFEGLRRGEICRLREPYLDLDTSTILVQGKGGHERRLPLLGPVLDEIRAHGGLARGGWVVHRNGRPYAPERMSIDSHGHLRRLGVATTLHSMRHTFATTTAATTKDLLFVRDLLGHRSVATTEIYTESTMTDAHLRLAKVATLADDLLHPARPAAARVDGVA